MGAREMGVGKARVGMGMAGLCPPGSARQGSNSVALTAQAQRLAVPAPLAATIRP